MSVKTYARKYIMPSLNIKEIKGGGVVDPIYLIVWRVL
jgi:hypothetical protein